MKIGTTAPSGSNCQEWTFTIIPTKKDVAGLAEKIGIFFKRLNKLSKNIVLRKGMALLGNNKLDFYYENYYESVKETIELYEKEGIDKLFHGATSVIMVGGINNSKIYYFLRTSTTSISIILKISSILLNLHVISLISSTTSPVPSVPRIIAVIVTWAVVSSI